MGGSWWRVLTKSGHLEKGKSSLVAQMVKRLSTMQETWVRSLGWEDPLEKEMAIHSSTIAWKIPWTGEPGRLQSMGSQRVGEGNGKSLQYSCLENTRNSMKMQKDRTLKDELPRLVGARYATGDEWRNNYRKNEEMGPKLKQHPDVELHTKVISPLISSSNWTPTDLGSSSFSVLSFCFFILFRGFSRQEY